MTTEAGPGVPDSVGVDGAVSSGVVAAAGADGGEAVADTSLDRVPRSARWFVGLVLAALIVPGLIGAEAWPLTGWKLFSLSRDESQTVWVLEAVDADGATRDVSLEDLPLGYRHAEWPLSDLLGASSARRDAVCDALLGAIGDRYPETVELRLVRDHQTLVEQGGDWVITHDPEEFHRCPV